MRLAENTGHKKLPF